MVWGVFVSAPPPPAPRPTPFKNFFPFHPGTYFIFLGRIFVTFIKLFKRLLNMPTTNKKIAVLTPTKVRRARNKDLSIKYYLQGRTTLDDVCSKIKEVTGFSITRGTVSNYIKQAIIDWSAENGDIVENYVILEIAKVNALEVEYHEAFERSKQPVITQQMKQTPLLAAQDAKGKSKKNKKAPDLLLNEQISTHRTTAGDPRFLLGVQWCIDKRVELLAQISIKSRPEAEQSGNITTNTTIRKIVFRGKGELASIAETHQVKDVG